MSKLFEIMSRSKGEIPDLVRPLIDAEAGPAVIEKPETTGDGGAGTAVQSSGAAPLLVPAQFRMMSLRVAAHSPLLPFEPSQWRASEQYRILRTKLVQHPKQPRVIVVSSPASGDGKSVTAINTAAALSLKSEAQVLLLDADFRKSTVHTLLGLQESPGLAEVLRGACTVEEAVVRAQEFPNLYVMPAGKTPGNPVELLDSAAWQALISNLRNRFRYVVLDSPPVGAVADYDLIQAVCDGVILVVRPDHTGRPLCQASLEAVPKAKFLGVLLNCVPDWAPAKRAGGDYYYYYSGDKSYSANQGATKGGEAGTPEA